MNTSYTENESRATYKMGAIVAVLLLPVLAFIFLLGTQHALAGPSIELQATHCVTPDGGGSCLDSIGDALAVAGPGDTIRVAAGTYTENVLVTKTVTLEGGWNEGFTARNPATQVSTIRPEDETQSVVSIENADPTVDGFTITGGRADLGGNHGGGMRLIDSQAVVRNNVIVGNRAYLLGGGAWVQRGAPTLENNRIEDNLSLATGQDAFGGGVQVENSQAKLVGNIITGNAVSGTHGHGAGLDVTGGEVIVTNDLIEHNDAGSGYGGGICVSASGTVLVRSVTVYNNSASGGGGACSRSNAHLTLESSTLISNAASGNGGGIDNVGGTVTLIGTTVISNTTTFGGGIQNTGDGSFPGIVTLIDSTITDNEATGDGGGIYSDDQVTLIGSSVEANYTPQIGGGIVNSGGVLTVTDSTISNNRAGDSGGAIYNSGMATFTGVTLSRNEAVFNAGAIFNPNAGMLTLIETSIVSNTAGDHGGAVENSGRLTLTRSLVDDNTAGGDAGGITNSGTLAIDESAIVGNSAADDGGGVYASAAITVTDSTITGNDAGDIGGGVLLTTDTSTVINSTVSGNVAAGDGAGIWNAAMLRLANVTIAGNAGHGLYHHQTATTHAVNTIFADNAGANCSGDISSSGHNLEDADTCGLEESTDLPNTDPLLGPLADNGGPTLTHAIASDSPAVDAGNNDECPPTDQRGRPRVDGDFDGTVTCDVGAYEALIALTVNSMDDAVDADAGDGVCETAPGNGECTLRAAIQEANALGGVERITVPAGTYTLTIENAPVSTASPHAPAGPTGDLDIYVSLTIAGAGAETTVIDGGGIDRVFHIDPNSDGIEVNIEDVTIRGGMLDYDNGGGIYNNGILTLRDSIVTGNESSDPEDARAGGGIYNNGTLSLENVVVRENVANDGGGLFTEGATLTTLTNVTLRDNTAIDSAGGINNNGTLTVTNSTLSGNEATTFNGGGILNNAGVFLRNVTLSGNVAGDFGGAIRNANDVTMENVTIAENVADEGAGIYNDGDATLTNSIVAYNTGGNCVDNNALVSAGHNLEDANTCGFEPGLNDLIHVDPRLGPLQDNGGATDTHALRDGSPAIDAGNTVACPSTDQRGVPRPIDGDEDGAGVCDIGAVEYKPPMRLYLPVVIR